jgi:CHASE2 domain-containing sensor protein
MRLRPDEGPDERLLVITVTEADIQAQNQEQRKGSLSDRSLFRLLEKLEQYQPQSIGLDIYRDFPVEAKYKDLATRLQKSDRFVAICRVSNPEVNDPGVPPPPEIPVERLGFSDVVLDPDGIIRRHLLAMTPAPASPCTASYALSSQLAFRYLEAKGISPKFTPEGNLQLGNSVFKRLKAHTGGYQQVDTWGNQVLLNYRSYRSLQNIAPQVTLTQVLNGQLNPNLVKDRIVLIGVTATSAGDYLPTPYSAGQSPYQKMAGVLIQAQMVSQILSAVLDRRPLLWVWTGWVELLWVWGWSLIGGMLALRFGGLLHLVVIGVAALGILYGLCFVILIQGGWVPLIPSAIALVVTNGSLAAYIASQARQKKSIN